MKFLLLTALLASLGASGVAAQSVAPPIQGRRFIIALPDTTATYAPTAMRGSFPDDDAFLIFFASETTDVTVRSVADGATATVRVLPSSSAVLSIRDIVKGGIPLLDEVDRVSRKTFEIIADDPVVTYVYFFTASGSEAYTPLPVEGWGKEYLAATFSQTFVWDVDIFQAHEEGGVRPVTAPASVVVIAAEDRTEVRIAPNSATGELERILFLDAGEAYQIQTKQVSTSPGYPQPNLGGARITANRPIGVMSGNTRTPVEGSGIFKTPNAPWMNTLENVTAEWLWPTLQQGRTFALSRVARFPADLSDEIVRVYGLSEGYTHVTASTGESVDIRQGEFTDFHSAEATRNDYRPPEYRSPMVLTADKPVQAVLLTGPYSESKSTTSAYQERVTFSSATSTAVPHEFWHDFVRFHSPTRPSFLRHWVSVVADSGALLRLDGGPVTLKPFPSGPYAHALVEVDPGDHALESEGGLFTAIVYGNAAGTYAYRPLRTRKQEEHTKLGDGREGPQLLHPSQYYEIPGITYAYTAAAVVRSPLTVTWSEGCDRAEVVARNLDSMRHGPFSMTIDPTTDNIDVTIVREQGLRKSLVSYRIAFVPRNPDLDGRSSVTITGKDTSWVFPYTYSSRRLAIVPDSVNLTDVPKDVSAATRIVLTNTKTSPVVIRSIRLLHDFGNNGGFRITTLPPKGVIEGGESGSFTISFSGRKGGMTYTDSLLVETDCGPIYLPLRGTTTLENVPYPEITGHDWKSRRLTTADSCTKSGISFYDTVIFIRNIGARPFAVRSIELRGPDADAGYFLLDSSDPSSTVRPSTIVEPDGGKGVIHAQRVLFRPDAERRYTCVVKLTTEEGLVSESSLEGSGVEPHVTIAGYDFAPLLLGSTASVSGTAPVAAEPTTTLTVTGLRIVGRDAADFRFAPDFLDTLPTPSAPWVLAPGEVVRARVEFLPTTPGAKNASIEVVGDHSRCDDSTATLTGRVFRTTAGGAALAAATGCAGESADLTLLNDGPEDLLISDFLLDDPNSAFTVVDPPIGGIVAPGETLRVTVRFVPPSDGTFGATARFSVRSRDGMSDLGSLAATITGTGWSLVSSAYIERGYSALPGRTVPVPVTLEEPIDAAGAAELLIAIDHDPVMMRLVSVSPGRMLSGAWRAEKVTEARDRTTVRLYSTDGSTVRGRGSLLDLSLTLFLGDRTGAELPFTIELPAHPCISIATTPGRLSIDSICGLNQRLITVSAEGYALEEARPNPFNPTTRIVCSVGLEGPTTITIHDVGGREVARPLDGVLAAGEHRITWDASEQPSGLYFCRMRSGGWTATRPLLLVK